MSAYAAAAVGGLLNIGGGLISNSLAKERERIAREENYKYGEMAASNADLRTRRLYEDYQSPEALLRQYKNAGLSPSLMFQNGTGAGGMTQGAQGTGAAGISPTTYGINVMEGAQLGLMQAQARKLNAEADTEEGKNERGKTEIQANKAEIDNIIAKTKNEGLKSAWYEYENAAQSIKVGIAASTSDIVIDNFIQENNYLKHKIRSAAVKADIDEATKNTMIRYTDEQVKNVIADTLLKEANKLVANKSIEVSDKQIEDLTNQITNRDKNTEINDRTLKQTIRAWAVKNGIIGDDEASWKDILQRNVFSEQTITNLIELVKALK